MHGWRVVQISAVGVFGAAGDCVLFNIVGLDIGKCFRMPAA